MSGLSTAQMFASQKYNPVLEDMSIGAPARWQNDIPLSSDAGSFMQKFRDPKVSGGGMSPRQSLSSPGFVPSPGQGAQDVMANYAHGLQGTLIINEPSWNSNRTLMGQPQVPVRPMDLCPVLLSSHGALGALAYNSL
jgi:hypothetical protein